MIIKIKDLRLKTILGIHDWEQNILRQISINIDLLVEDELATISDDIKDTVDYAILVDMIKKFITNNKFKLIEKMAADIIDIIMNDQKISQCNLEINKIGVLENVDAVAIFLSKKR
jgi:dihydroneopterin aldolase